MNADRDEWLAWRRQGIGASDVPGLMGLSPWESPYSIWADKMGLVDDDDPTDAMTHGLWAEHSIVPWFEQETGLTVGFRQYQAVGPDDWMLATLDGAAFELGRQTIATEGPWLNLSDALALIECKATADSPRKWEDEGIPIQYAVQATWQTIVTGIPTVKFAVLHVPFGRLTFRIYDYTPDLDDIALVTRTASDFYHNHIVTKTAPDPDAHPATTAAIRHRYNITDPDDILYADPVTSDYVYALREAKRNLANAEQRVTLFENALKDRMADCAELRDDHGVLATWRSQTTDRIDVKRLRAEHPDIASEYTTTTRTRVFRLKDTKDD
jgi:putative phage-type endonuclease